MNNDITNQIESLNLNGIPIDNFTVVHDAENKVINIAIPMYSKSRLANFEKPIGNIILAEKVKEQILQGPPFPEDISTRFMDMS